MPTIIRAENLSKRYYIGGAQSPGGSLRDSLAGLLRSPLRGLRGGSERLGEEFWALKDVSFSVEQGEIVGIIGRNGAGKSTLLKVLSRITEPTAGRVELRGRVGSLLEVGTGFHPELSGRENIYLNGSILGMKRAEIEAKFDEIVAFAEIEKFLEMPVKRYSSGMYVRLAFAVAAHLEPEVLIVDEVLAVGDAGFQKKCLGKMGDVAGQGRTVLFVSHNMGAVTRLCNRAIWLSGGAVMADGPSHAVVSQYLNSDTRTAAERAWPDAGRAPGDEVARLRGFRVCTEDGRTAETIDIRRPVGIEMVYDVLRPGHVLVPNFHFYNEEGVCVFIIQDLNLERRREPRQPGRHVSTAWIPGNMLAEGMLYVTAALTTFYPMNVHFHEADVIAFQVVDSLEGDSARGDYAGTLPGVVRPIFNWTARHIATQDVLEAVGQHR